MITTMSAATDCGNDWGYGTPSDRTLKLGRSGAWRCVSLGSVYVAARVGAVCLLHGNGAERGWILGIDVATWK